MSFTHPRFALRRIAVILGELGEFAGVEVKVSSGIVTLTGSVVSSAAAEKAVDLARHVEGVVEVKDELTVDPQLGRRMKELAVQARAFGVEAVAVAPL